MQYTYSSTEPLIASYVSAHLVTYIKQNVIPLQNITTLRVESKNQINKKLNKSISLAKMILELLDY